MPTYTHEVVAANNLEFLDQIYQLGIDSQLPAEMGCSPVPWPSRTTIRKAMSQPNVYSYAIYADSELRAVVTFRDSGEIVFCISKPWHTKETLAQPGTTVHPNGLEQTKYMFDLIREITGTVKTYNQSQAPAVVAAFKNGKVVRIELNEAGSPTGNEQVIQ